MRKHKIFAAAVLLLLSGCGARPISQRQVVAALAIDVSAQPWQAAFEILQEEENTTYTAEGTDFAGLCAETEHRYGYPLYFGAAECIVLSGVENADALRNILFAISNDPQIGANTQICLCADAEELLSAAGSEAISSLLTGQYARSNDYSLAVVLAALADESEGTLLPVLQLKEDVLQLQGYQSSHAQRYGIVWDGNELLGLLTGRYEEQTVQLDVEGNTVEVGVSDCRQIGLRFTGENAIAKISLTAVLLGVDEIPVARQKLMAALEKETYRQLKEIKTVVQEQGNTELFHTAWFARWQGVQVRQGSGVTGFTVFVNLQDPKHLLRE